MPRTQQSHFHIALLALTACTGSHQAVSSGGGGGEPEAVPPSNPVEFESGPGAPPSAQPAPAPTVWTDAAAVEDLDAALANLDGSVVEPDACIDKACPRCPTPEGPCPEGTPCSPARVDVIAVMDPVKGVAADCGQGVLDGGTLNGTVVVTIAVAGATGRVTEALAEGDAPSEVLDCVERATRAAHFPIFCNEFFHLKYPFRITAP